MTPRFSEVRAWFHNRPFTSALLVLTLVASVGFWRQEVQVDQQGRDETCLRAVVAKITERTDNLNDLAKTRNDAQTAAFTDIVNLTLVLSEPEAQAKIDFPAALMDLTDPSTGSGPAFLAADEAYKKALAENPPPPSPNEVCK